MHNHELETLPPYTDADAPEAEAREEFHICDESSANWLLRKLAGIEAERARVTQQYQAIVAQLDSDAERLRFCYEAEFSDWTRRELARRKTTRKSLVLLQGTCQFRTVPAGVKVADISAALHYATAALPELVKTAPTLDTLRYRSAALTALNTTGEVLPGIERTEERESFTLKFGGKD